MPTDVREIAAAGASRPGDGKAVRIPRKSVEAFTREVMLMPLQDNRTVFPSAYIWLYWGKRK